MLTTTPHKCNILQELDDVKGREGLYWKGLYVGFFRDPNNNYLLTRDEEYRYSTYDTGCVLVCCSYVDGGGEDEFVDMENDEDFRELLSEKIVKEEKLEHLEQSLSTVG